MSSQANDEDVELSALVAGGDATDSGVPGGELLTAFAEAGVGDDTDAIRDAREAVRAELGDAATVDAAGVIANFQRMVRIADGTGIPLDSQVMAMTTEIREDLGINDYPSSKNSSEPGWFGRWFGPLILPHAHKLLARMARN